MAAKPNDHSNNGDNMRLLVVSNRLPVTLKMENENEPTFSPSSGGLVTALTGMGDLKFSWVGWLGAEVPAEQQQQITDKLKKDFNYLPVYLEKKMSEDYYNGFANSILWPLFHYLFEKEDNFKAEQWEAYQAVNKIFAQAVLKIYQPGDYIWIQDYHLMLLPALLREALPESRIGFFLHIPFPSSEIYRTLPVRSEILKGLLASNLIGFHTFDYCRHFLSSCIRTLGSETTSTGLIHNGLNVTVGCFPIGIDPKKFTDSLEKSETKERIKQLQKQFAKKKILIGIDRLDYTKGLPLKLQAFERFLQKYPARAKDTVLIQIAVPTREDVQEYKDLVNEVNELVGRINSKFGSVDDYPIHYLHKSIPFGELSALYYIADACLVTAIRDGMNLVCIEYIACQREKHGVLLLSEFAGASVYMSGSILINPFNIEGTADDINMCLELSSEEREVRFKRNEDNVFEQNTALKWGTTFIDQMKKACDPQNYFLTKTPPLTPKFLSKYDSYLSKPKRLFFFDYDGTLVNIEKLPHLAFPKPNVLSTLQKLASNPNNIVVVSSGRDRNCIQEWLGKLPIGLVAEHGMVYRPAGEQVEWTSLFDDVDLSWMPTVEAILHHVVDRIAGSMLEKKKTSLCFHYRNVEASYAEWRVNELKQHLTESLGHLPTEIIMGKKVLEVRCKNVNKGAAMKKVMNQLEPNFVFCAGDDRTDEDMFEILRSYDNALSCFIGAPDNHTAAKSRLGSPDELLDHLKNYF